jgi:multidrug efflux pump subunit AcrA (membrane-fusion protein)
MSEPTFPPAPAVPVPPVTLEEAQAQAAAQLAAQAQATTADAGPTVEQITAQMQREVLLPMETKISDMMAAFEALSKEQGAQIKALQAQLAAAQAAVGEPELTAHADGLAGLLERHSAVFGHPDIYKPVRQVAADLQAAAKDVVAGTGDVERVRSLAAEVGQWLGKLPPSDGNWGSVLASLESIGVAVAKLA